VGRVIAAGPGGTAQAPARDDRAAAIIAAVVDGGMIGQVKLSPPCPSIASADELRRAIYRSARIYCSCGKGHCTRKYGNVPRDGYPEGGCPLGGLRVSATADVVRDGNGAIRVQFTLRDKREGIRHVIATYGPDPESWPYFARRKRLKG
jgi:hypothetical protein